MSMDKTTLNNKMNNLSPALDDQPSLNDYLDFGSYVYALKDLILHDKTRTPLTVGVFGRWGMGKTTLLQMLEKELARQEMVTIWFNAWQYSKEDELWAAFLQSMLNKIQNSLGVLQLPVFKAKLLFKRLALPDFPLLAINYLMRGIIAFLPVLIIDPVSQQLSPNARGYLEAGGNIAGLLLAVFIVIKPFVEAVRDNVSINISNFQQTSDYQEHIAFLDKFREHFADIVQSLPRNGDKRLAVFIDDLDRCSPEQAIQILDAIKLFVDIPGCVYILGLDIDVVQKAVISKYPDDPIAQREYMGKIIQIPFQLPPLTRNELQIFLEQLKLDLPNTMCREVFITGLVVNPREVKRTINIFSLLWNLSEKRPELASKINPVRLAKIVVIQQIFPELHKILQQRPNLLIELEKFFQAGRADEARVWNELQSIEDNPEEPKGNSDGVVLKKPDLNPELLSFSKHEALRSMLLIKNPSYLTKPENDDYVFQNLNAEDIAIYFTLTSRAESPKPDYRSRRSSSLAGMIFGGRYEIKHEIASGGMTTVYLAYDQRLKRDVAVKVFNKMYWDDVSILRRFEQEIEILSRSRHPSLISILDSGIEKDEGPYYVMEYMAGGNLKELLSNNKTLSNKEIFDYIVPILDPLGYIHARNIVHRDIKPASILFDIHMKPFLSDFSIAKLLKQPDPKITASSSIIGTPLYMSPEQARGEQIDARSDLYSFGCLLFECVTGKEVFSGGTPMEVVLKHLASPIPAPRSLNQSVSIKLEAIIVKLLAKIPDDRFQTVEEVKDALLKAL